MRKLSSLLLLSFALLAAPACGGGGGPATLDVPALKEGADTTAKLKFWMKELGSHGGGMAENIHFDDAKNVRVVLYYDASFKEKVDKLEQNKTYEVTFKTEKAGGKAITMVTGTLVALK